VSEDTIATFEITALPDDPFFEGSGPAAPEEHGLHVGIDGRGFMLDFSDHVGYYHRYQRLPIALTNTQQANSGQDLAQVAPEVWRRSIESWDAGAGQDRYDREASQPYRFSDSYRVDVFDPWKVSLLPDTTDVQTFGSGRSFVTTVGPDQLFAGTGDAGWWWTDLVETPVEVTLDHDTLAATSDGQALYLLDDTGVITRWVDPLTFTTFATLTAFTGQGLLVYVKGFLLVSDGPSLYDVSTGTAELIYTHPLAAFTWVDGCEGPTAAYLLGGMGDRWMVYKMGLQTDASTFDPPSQAAPLPDGEIGYALATYLGYLLIGLDTGWRFGIPDGSGNISFGRLIETQAPVHCFEGQDHFVWFGLEAATDGAEFSGLGRADLATFTNPLTPAYAPDLSATDTSGAVWAAATFKGKRVFAVDGFGLFAQTDDLAPDGWIEQGQISYNTSDDKMGLYLEAHHDPLRGSLAIDLSYDGAEYVEAGRNTSAGSSATGRVSMARAFKTVAVRVRLTRDTDTITQGPTLTRVEIRAMPVSGGSTEWRLPLILSENITYLNATEGRSLRDDYDLLIELYTTKRPFTFREFTRRYTVYCTDFLWLGEMPNTAGTDLQGLFVFVCREIR
jgi:hypothetical protein